YGKDSDWSDNYFSKDIWDTLESALLSPSPSLTEGPLTHAYNVDVTWLDPAKNVQPFYCSSPSSTPATLTACGYQALSTHWWPHDFYTNSIPPNTIAGLEGFGFALSKEGGNWDYAMSH